MGLLKAMYLPSGDQVVLQSAHESSQIKEILNESSVLSPGLYNQRKSDPSVFMVATPVYIAFPSDLKKTCPSLPIVK